MSWWINNERKAWNISRLIWCHSARRGPLAWQLLRINLRSPFWASHFQRVGRHHRPSRTCLPPFSIEAAGLTRLLRFARHFFLQVSSIEIAYFWTIAPELQPFVSWLSFSKTSFSSFSLISLRSFRVTSLFLLFNFSTSSIVCRTSRMF